MSSRNLSTTTNTTTQTNAQDDGFQKEEQEVIDFYFSTISTLRTCFHGFFVSKFLYLFYLAMGLTAIVGAVELCVEFELSFVVTIFIILEGVAVTLCAMTTRNILGNEVMINSYVEYKVKTFFNEYPGLSPIMSLYFNDNIVDVKRNKRTISAMKRKSWRYKFLFFCYAFIICILYFVGIVGAGVSQSLLIIPFLLTSFLTAAVNTILFEILDSSLDHSKMEFLKSPFFHNDIWDKIVVVLGTNTRYQKKNDVYSLSWFKKKEEDDEISATLGERYESECYDNPMQIQLKPLRDIEKQSTMYKDEHAMDAQKQEETPSSNLSESSRKSSGIFDTVFRMSRLNSIQNAAVQFMSKARIQFEVERRVQNKKREKFNEVTHRLLNEERERLDFDKFRQDLYILQHSYQVINKVLGNTFSIYLAFSISTLGYSLWLTVTYSKRLATIDVGIELLNISGLINTVLTLMFMVKHNSFALSIASFCSPILLLCEKESIDDILSIRDELVRMNLYIRIFGYALTKEYLFSIAVSLALSVVGQIYILAPDTFGH